MVDQSKNHSAVGELYRPLGEPVEWSGAEQPMATVHEGSYVRLEPLRVEHAEALFEAGHPPNAGDELWDYLPYGPFADSAALAEFIREAQGTDPLFFAICERESGRPRGVESFMRIDAANGVIEIGHVWFSPLIQRSRLGTEAVFLLMRHAFDDLGYRRLEWKCNALNAASKRAAERYGLTFEGCFRQAKVVKGRNRDTSWFSMIDREWPLARTALTDWLNASNFAEGGEQRRSLSEIRTQLSNSQQD